MAVIAEKNSCRSIFYLQTIMFKDSYSYFLDNIGRVLTEELYEFYFSLTWRESEATLDDCLNLSDTVTR